MIASLMMYERPELAAANATWWRLIAERLRAAGVDCPEHLSQTRPEREVWTHPGLVLSQTCGLPYRQLLHQRVQLVGTPDYGLPDCPPGHYQSVLVARRDDPREALAAFRDGVFAFNQELSQSGYVAAHARLQCEGFWFARQLRCGAHRASAQAVAQGRADIASIDAVSWRLLQRFDTFAAGLRVVARTEPTPGLPLICAPALERAQVRAAVSGALDALPGSARELLGIEGLVDIDRAAYLAVATPELPACRRWPDD